MIPLSGSIYYSTVAYLIFWWGGGEYRYIKNIVRRYRYTTLKFTAIYQIQQFMYRNYCIHIIRAIGVSHTACKVEFRQKKTSQSWSVFSFLSYTWYTKLSLRGQGFGQEFFSSRPQYGILGTGISWSNRFD